MKLDSIKKVMSKIPKDKVKEDSPLAKAISKARTSRKSKANFMRGISSDVLGRVPSTIKKKTNPETKPKTMKEADEQLEKKISGKGEA